MTTLCRAKLTPFVTRTAELIVLILPKNGNTHQVVESVYDLEKGE